MPACCRHDLEHGMSAVRYARPMMAVHQSVALCGLHQSSCSSAPSAVPPPKNGSLQLLQCAKSSWQSARQAASRPLGLPELVSISEIRSGSAR